MSDAKYVKFNESTFKEELEGTLKKSILKDKYIKDNIKNINYSFIFYEDLPHDTIAKVRVPFELLEQYTDNVSNIEQQIEIKISFLEIIAQLNTFIHHKQKDTMNAWYILMYDELYKIFEDVVGYLKENVKLSWNEDGQMYYEGTDDNITLFDHMDCFMQPSCSGIFDDCVGKPTACIWWDFIGEKDYACSPIASRLYHALHKMDSIYEIVPQSTPLVGEDNSYQHLSGFAFDVLQEGLSQCENSCEMALMKMLFLQKLSKLKEKICNSQMHNEYYEWLDKYYDDLYNILEEIIEYFKHNVELERDPENILGVYITASWEDHDLLDRMKTIMKHDTIFNSFIAKERDKTGIIWLIYISA